MNKNRLKVIFASLCLFASMAFIVPSAAQTTDDSAKRPRPNFSMFDQDGNGEATREELTAVLKNQGVVDRFLFLDVNRDGVVSKEEYDTPPKRQAGPWEDPEVVKAALNIGMSAEQQTKFREIISEYIVGINTDISRLLKSNNRAGLGKRRIASKKRARVNTMNGQMEVLLSPEQYPKYEVYRDLLLNKMKKGRRKR